MWKTILDHRRYKMDFCRVDIKKGKKMRTCVIFEYRDAANLYLEALKTEFAADVEDYEVEEIICKDSDGSTNRKYIICPKSF